MKKKQNARGNRGLWEMDKVKKAALRYAFPKTAPVMEPMPPMTTTPKAMIR